MIRTVLLGAVALVTFAAPAMAEAGRYQLQPVEGGIVRLDTATGAMDFCRSTGAGLECKEAAAAPVRAAVKLDEKAMEAELAQATKAMDLALPMMMKSLSRMQESMSKELGKTDKRAN
jgi:hypothetical protein